jgi:hypothetical protein
MSALSATKAVLQRKGIGPSANDIQDPTTEFVVNQFKFVQSNVVFKHFHKPVMTVTERSFRMGDTPFVNMVRRACTNALFEPGDTK